MRLSSDSGGTLYGVGHAINGIAEKSMGSPVIFLAATARYALLVAALTWFLRWLSPAWRRGGMVVTAHAPTLCRSSALI